MAHAPPSFGAARDEGRRVERIGVTFEGGDDAVMVLAESLQHGPPRKVKMALQSGSRAVHGLARVNDFDGVQLLQDPRLALLLRKNAENMHGLGRIFGKG